MITLLAAHIMFDGWLCRNERQGKFVVGYASKSPTLIARVERLLTLYGCPHIYRRKRKNGVTEIECYSKRVYRRVFLEQGRIRSGEVSTIEAFYVVKAFWEDEGTVSIDRGRVRLRARQKDQRLLQTLISYHEKIGVPTRLDYDGMGVLVSGLRNVRLFSSIIGFSPGIYVGRSRSNTHYGMEKRKLLHEHI